MKRMRVPGGFAWGFVDQSLSSLENFGLSLLAGRLLGPSGLGVIAVGFGGYVLAVTLQRSLVSEPLVVRSSRLAQEERIAGSRSALSVTLVVGAAAAAFIALLGLALPGDLGHGLVLFSPWILPALLQDFWRSILFRDGRGAGAALNDAVWVLGMLVAIPFAVELETAWAVLAGWGLGATASAALGFRQTRLVPAPLALAWRTWKRDDWPFGRWLSGGSVVQAASGQAVLVALAAILGPAAVGGLRAAQTIFAPLTLLAAAANFPGLPAMSKALDVSRMTARALAFKVSAVLVAITLLYLVVVGVFRTTLLGGVFGGSFVEYAGLVLPVGGQQILLACGIGFVLLLKASLSGRVLIWNRAIGALATVALATILAWAGGLRGAAWGLAAGTGVTTAFNGSFALWPAWSRARLVPNKITRARPPLPEAEVRS